MQSAYEFRPVVRRPWSCALNKGTGLAEFEKAFPDETSCRRYIFETRFGARRRCAICRRPTPWLWDDALPYGRSMCCGSRKFPVRGTLFQASRRVSLKDWFRALQLSANVSGTPGVRMLGCYFDLSVAAAARMAKVLRLQMALQEASRVIGAVDRHVYAVETEIRRLSRQGVGDPKHKRIVVLTDESKVAFAIPETPRPEHLFRALRTKIAPGTTIHCGDEALYRKLATYTQRWHPIATAGPGARPAAVRSEICILQAKGTIRRLYHHVTSARLWAYLDEQAFRLNAPHDRSLSWSALQTFPPMPGRLGSDPP